MKILAIPDLNGFSAGLDYATSFINVYDKIIFLGNLLGSDNQNFAMQQELFTRAIMLKSQYPNKVVLCLGAAELSYLTRHKMIDFYSHPNEDTAHSIIDMTIDLFEVVHQENGVFFSSRGMLESASFTALSKALAAKDYESLSKIMFPTSEDSKAQSPLFTDPAYLKNFAIKSHDQIVGSCLDEAMVMKTRNDTTIYACGYDSKYSVIIYDTDTNEVVWKELYHGAKMSEEEYDKLGKRLNIKEK